MVAARAQVGTGSRRGSILWLLASCLCTFLIGACTTTVERVSDARELKSLGFLQAGGVTRGEVIGRLGNPASSYEAGRIVIYAVEKNDDRFEVSTTTTAHYRLVVVYGPDETIDRWSLVNLAR